MPRAVSHVLLTFLIASSCILISRQTSTAEEATRAIGSTKPGAGYSRYDELVNELGRQTGIFQAALDEATIKLAQVNYYAGKAAQYLIESKDPENAAIAEYLERASQTNRRAMNALEQDIRECWDRADKATQRIRNAKKELTRLGYNVPETNPWPSAVINKASPSVDSQSRPVTAPSVKPGTGGACQMICSNQPSKQAVDWCLAHCRD